jgi:hypothetical protein
MRFGEEKVEEGVSCWFLNVGAGRGEREREMRE